MSDLKKIPIQVEHTQKSKPPGGQEPQVIELYEAAKKLYPRSSKGTFSTWRIIFVLATQVVFLGLPWLSWNNRQAVLFDLVNRKFFLFGFTVWPQDFVYLAALLMCSAFGLFLWTTIAGRLWCGYSCPQTVYTEVMLWIEQWIEGDRNKRIKLDKQPMSLKKLRIKVTKHSIMLLFSLWTGFTLVGYFTPIQSLVHELPGFNYGPWELFWTFFYGGFTYLFAGFMREQVCKYMCPYARFQSVMFDADTLIISYDAERGEPRGARKKGVDYKAEGLGSCINCSICVQVCPVGIDIRDGLQYECIGCAACIDACDEVMDKVGYPRGLIRYTTENAMEGHYPEKHIPRRLKRPRVVMYSLVLLIILTAAIVSIIHRQPFKVDIIRDRATLVQETQEGWLENRYIVKIINITEKDRKFKISVNGLPGIKMNMDSPSVAVKATETESVDVRVEADPQYATKGSHEIHFKVEAIDNPAINVEEKSSFIGE